MEKLIGACLFCGQTSGAPGEYKSQREADEAATMLCTCDGAKKERAAEAGRNRLRAMFACEPEDISILLVKILNAVAAGEIEAATVKIDGNTKCKISCNSKGDIDVQRVDTTVRREIL